MKHWQDGVSALMGAWLIVSPWALGFEGDAYAMGNAVLIGIALAGVALGAVYVPRAWEEWTECALGLWLTASPWVLGVEAQLAARNNAVLAGLAVLALGFWVLLTDKDYRQWLNEAPIH
jgi:hypothetical protein